MRDERRSRSRRLDATAIISLILVAAACAGQAPAATAPPGAATAPASSAAVAEPPTQPPSGLETLSVADRAALADATLQRVPEYETRVEAAMAERSGLLAVLGPEGVAWLAEDRDLPLTM